MFDKLNEGFYPDFIERHLTELDQRIGALKDRMAAMILEKYEIRNQEILLSVMLETRKELETLSVELGKTSNESYSVP